MSMTYRMLAALAVALAVLVTAALAEAATFTTDSTGAEADATPGDGTCAKSGGGCTLQAAVDEVNARNAGDTIRHEVPTVDGDGVTVTVNNITIDGTQAAGFVACTPDGNGLLNCTAGNWVGKVDLDGGTGTAILFADGTTGSVVKGIEVYGGDGTTDYGIILNSGAATDNRVHDLHGGIMCKGTPCTIETNWAHEIVDFGFTAQGGGVVITGNLGCLDADGETDAGAMDFCIYVEDGDDVEVTGDNLCSACDQAAVRVKETSDNTIISGNTFGPTRSGATTLCSGFVAFSDAGSGTSYSDNSLCPVPTGCCNISGLPGVVTCFDHTVNAGTAPTSEAECETLIDTIVGDPEVASASGFNAEAVCDPDALGTCAAAGGASFAPLALTPLTRALLAPTPAARTAL